MSATAYVINPVMREVGKRIADLAFPPQGGGPLAAAAVAAPRGTGDLSGLGAVVEPSAAPLATSPSSSPTPLPPFEPWTILRKFGPPLLVAGLAIIGLRAGWSWAKTAGKCRVN